MIKLLLMIFIALFYQPIRPPALTQSDIPFVFDPNMVQSDILTYLEVRPSNRVISIPRQVIEPDGEYGILTCNDQTVYIPSAFTSIDPDDPNGISRIHDYFCTIRAGTIKRVIYLNFTFIDDPNGESYAPKSDTRTVLINVRKINRKPVISK